MNLSDTIHRPRHVAIIMDGNGRWAQSRSRERAYGHLSGITPVREVLKSALRAGVEVLTLYTFSEENWLRPKEEVDALMELLISSIQNEVPDLRANGVRLIAIGATERLPIAARTALAEAMAATATCDKITLVLALSYSARVEITSAARRLAEQVASGELSPQDIDEKMVGDALYTAGLPDPDLLIRTGGECRISNFLLWQIAYTELYFCDVFWPDFSEQHFYEALEDFSNRQRRFGKTGEQVAPPQA